MLLSGPLPLQLLLQEALVSEPTRHCQILTPQLPEWPYTVRPALLVAVGDPTSSSMQPDAWPKVGSEERDLLLEDLLKYILH